MRSILTRPTTAALVAAVVASAAIIVAVGTHRPVAGTNHRSERMATAPRVPGGMVAAHVPGSAASPPRAHTTSPVTSPTPMPEASASMPSTTVVETPCLVPPLAGDGVWPVVDGAVVGTVAPTCGIVTDVGVPSRTQWITTGSPSSCTWTTYGDPSAGPGSVIATWTGSGPSLMAFADGVAAVRATGCGAWVPWPASDSYWLGRPSPSTAPFGDGVHPFWLGIADGTWQASGGPSCRWQVLRGFTGTSGDVVDAGSSTGPTSVTMAMAIGGDQTGDNHGGFAAQGCGTWTYVGGASIG